ncbi:rCG61844 [Rattus norvegicus]|uniref:RCG61844 n=1 Tax=Rattus norvegicus TaxID=10116 RepID=A6H9F9_RAT|nr:rCG61844 [Rattus norvegicus]
MPASSHSAHPRGEKANIALPKAKAHLGLVFLQVNCVKKHPSSQFILLPPQPHDGLLHTKLVLQSHRLVLCNVSPCQTLNSATNKLCAAT